MREPRRLVAHDFLELLELVRQEIERHGEPFEWLIRDFNR